jgi:hypothetical protein
MNVIKMPVYKHMNKRVLNLHSGSLGTITKAEKRGKTSWEITITYDDTDYAMQWSPADLASKHDFVDADYHHHLPDPKTRALALINGDRLPNKFGYYVSRVQKAWDEVNQRGGMDSITYCSSYPASLGITLWGARRTARESDLDVDVRDLKNRDPHKDTYDQLHAALRAKVEAMQ